MTMPPEPARGGLTIGIAGPIDLQLLLGRLSEPGPATPGYAAPVISHLVMRLLDRGHQVVVFTTSPHAADPGVYRGDGLTLVVCPSRPRLRWIDAFKREREALTSAMRSHPCDLIHAHWTYEFALAAMKAGPPCLVTVHDWGPTVLRYQLHHYRLVRLGMQIRVLTKARNLTANSPHIAARIRRFCRRDVPVIPNGTEVPEQLPARPPSQGLIIGALNNGFGPLKNVTALLKAFAVVRRQLPHAELHLAGVGFEVNGEAARWASEHGLADGVTFVGQIAYELVSGFMRSLDLFVHPALEESFGLVLIEAIIEGTPVIAGTDSGAVAWVLGDGVAGVLVDVRSPAALADAVIHLAASPAEREQLARSAFEHTRANFSLERVVDQYEAEYRRILA